MLGNLFIVFSALAMLHAAYSTYEHLSHLKALGRPEGSLPSDILIETLFALVLGIIGSVIRTPALREVTWRSEMKRRSAEEQDPRLSFTTFAQRAGLLAKSEPTRVVEKAGVEVQS
ncbi:membrane magnesium transporter-domain-containing protein [Cristinia sonorae]|uniref:Membrane magnesium transporter-domain-containing protein n=1 Tax=Cristinia sonorae TaxID=1940300 RepID=A0A8K0UJP4_9AGAR|nr:membrane magnesium transporter-domain-containing protein [Cristinia sonorae]